MGGIRRAGETELRTLQRTTAGATRERMRRELAEAPVALWLENLHWSDAAG